MYWTDRFKESLFGQGGYFDPPRDPRLPAGTPGNYENWTLSVTGVGERLMVNLFDWLYSTL